MFIPMRAGSKLEMAKAAIAIWREPARRLVLIDDLVARLYVHPTVAAHHPLAQIIMDATGEMPVADKAKLREVITNVVDIHVGSITGDSDANEWDVLLAEWEAEIAVTEGRVQ